MNDEKVAQILAQADVVAVIGLSDKPWRASHGVARYLQGAGYRVVPVNPNIEESLGQRAHGRLENLETPVDVVNVFRRSEFVSDLVDAAIASGARLFWMQEGVRDEQAAERLRAAGIEVVMDRCLMVEHMRLLARS